MDVKTAFLNGKIDKELYMLKMETINAKNRTAKNNTAINNSLGTNAGLSDRE